MKRLQIVAGVVFVLLALALFTLTPRATMRAQSAFLGLLGPFLKTGSALEKRIRSFREGVKTLEALERDNAALTSQNKELRTFNEMLKGLEGENARLRRALEYRERSVFKLIPAHVIARDSSTWWNTVRINRGFEHGVDSDMPVVTDEGLVGKTTTVAGSITTVLLLADENCKVAAKVEGSQEQGIVHGTRTSTAQAPAIVLSFLSKHANLQPGVKVYSSGVGGVFPAGVPIGVIQEFKAKELVGSATLVPAVDLTSIEDVFVVSGVK